MCMKMKKSFLYVWNKLLIPSYRFVLLLLAAAIIFSSHSTGQSNAADDFISRTLRFGSYSQIAGILAALKKKDNGFEALDLLVKDAVNINDRGVIRALLDLVSEKKLDQYYYLYSKLLEIHIDNDIAEYTLGSALTLPDIRPYEDFMKNALTNKNAELQKYAAMGLARLRTPGTREIMHEIFRESDNEFVRMELVSSIAAWADTADIPFFGSVIEMDSSTPVQKWVAVMALTNFRKDPAALALLQKLSLREDVEIRARALFALSFMDNVDNRELLFTACRDNIAKIRFYAVKALVNYTDSDTNELLKFKARYDEDSTVKKAAREILKNRGMEFKE